MTGVQYVTDDKGRKIGVLIDLRKHRELWEDLRTCWCLDHGGAKSGFHWKK